MCRATTLMFLMCFICLDDAMAGDPRPINQSGWKTYVLIVEVSVPERHAAASSGTSPEFVGLPLWDILKRFQLKSRQGALLQGGVFCGVYDIQTICRVLKIGNDNPLSVKLEATQWIRPGR